jgi:hypothetical protein
MAGRTRKATLARAKARGAARPITPIALLRYAPEVLLLAEMEDGPTHADAGAKGGRGHKASCITTSFHGATYTLKRLKRDRPKSFWTYRASTPTPTIAELPQGACRGTQAEWEALSPGMRREIARTVQQARPPFPRTSARTAHATAISNGYPPRPTPHGQQPQHRRAVETMEVE